MIDLLRGKFIAFEGPDGSGKSTQLVRFAQMAKRGGGARKVSLEDAPQAEQSAPPDVLEVDEALTELAHLEPELARIVEMRFFGGLKNDEVAEALGVSVPTVVRRWRLAKAWLYRYLKGTAEHGS